MLITRPLPTVKPQEKSRLLMKISFKEIMKYIQIVFLSDKWQSKIEPAMLSSVSTNIFSGFQTTGFETAKFGQVQT